MAEITQQDKELAISALQKKKRGEKITRVEKSALNKVERDREERLRFEFYKTIPKRHYQQMSGRPAMVLNRQCDNYGIPLRGNEVDLSEVLKWFHDFFADNANQISRIIGSSEEELKGKALKEHEQALALQRKRLKDEEVLLPREDVHQNLIHLAGIIRRAGERLGKRFGENAQKILIDALVEFEREVKKYE